MRKAIFLDRDGTLIEDADYLSRVEQVRFLPGAVDAVKRAQSAGWAVVLVTNQSGVGRGYFSETCIHEVHRYISQFIAFDGIYFCPHHPDTGCNCRKPKPGMLLRAVAELNLDLAASVMIGDKVDDVLAGLAAGCRAVRIEKDSPQLYEILLKETRP